MNIPAAPADQDRGTLLDVGSYNVQIGNVSEVTSKSGTPGIQIDYTCDVGEIREWVYITPKTRWKLQELLDACRVETPEGAFDLDIATLIEKTLRIVVEEKTFDGKKQTHVAGHELANRTANVSTKTAVSDDDIPF